MTGTLLFLLGLSGAHLAAEVIVPVETINLLADSEFKNFVSRLDAKLGVTVKREDAWSLTKDGVLRVTGKGWGDLRSKSKYRDYHLVVDYKWGEHTWGTRSDAARKAGILVHASGGKPESESTRSYEVELLEGRSGNLVVPSDEKNSLVLGKDQDPGWEDIKGFRGANEVENPVGEWNRMEVICQGDAIRVTLNGILVSEVTSAQPSDGHVSLWSEGAEVFFRRYELWPLGGFDEEWKPEERSTNTGYSETGASILPRREPWSPEKSQAAWRIDGDYELQLVAAEPLVCDPADVVWDERGRMFVAEMRDYPFPPKYGPRLARIRLLEDVNGDGRMDRARTWADGLNDVQGLLCINGGLLITCSEGILFLEDKDGDGAADKTTPLFTTSKPRHSQLQISSPRWRLDNMIHLNNGIDGKEIRPAGELDQVIHYKGFNLTYDPRTGGLTTESGVGQFGATTDAFGRVFFCSNRNPAMFAVLPRTVADRNPFAGFSSTHENIQPPASRVYPLELSHTTSIAHAGTHTSACGLAVYDGDWMPDLRGDLFVCDPTAQLVTRNRLLPKGASLQARRIGDRREFLASADEWSRPVNLRNGPDGALYICDMYRRFIDHAIYFPDAFSKSNYMRAGFDHGRIWRLAPKGANPRKIDPLPRDSSRLVRELASEISWRRIHAQRILVSRGGAATTADLTKLLEESDSSLGRLHAMWTLQGIHERIGNGLDAAQVVRATKDPVAGIVENALILTARRKDVDLSKRVPQLLRHADARVRLLTAALHGQHAKFKELAALIVTDGDDPWIRRAVLSNSPSVPAGVLRELLQQPDNALNRETLSEFAQAVAARGDLKDLAGVVGAIADKPAWLQSAVVLGLAKGLPRGRHQSLSSLLSNPPKPLAEKLDGVRSVVEASQSIVLDVSRPSSERIDALALVQGDLFPLAEELMAPHQPPEIQAAACRSLAGHDRNKVADFFFARWNSLAPIPRREALSLITGNSGTAVRLMKKMQSGEISKALMPAMNRWALSRSSDLAIKSLAVELFGLTEPDRARVISDYKSALTLGRAKQGGAVFEKAGCAICHAPGGSGHRIGPDIRDARIKPPDALLSDILDPNRAVEERWTVYQIKMRSGEERAGLITSESAAVVELSLPGGQRQSIPRDQIESLSSTGRSLMPEGLEASISKREMSDLIAFLKSSLTDSNFESQE